MNAGNELMDVEDAETSWPWVALEDGRSVGVDIEAPIVSCCDELDTTSDLVWNKCSLEVIRSETYCGLKEELHRWWLSDRFVLPSSKVVVLVAAVCRRSDSCEEVGSVSSV